MDWIIRAQHLAKKYRIRHLKQTRYSTLRDTLTETARNFFHDHGQALNGPPQSHSKREDFWALHDVSFEVRPGEKLGIIGRNGAGKTTLLKILSRITEPSTGRVELRGRVASLLEVGTGFHPELTGRENIFLNGAILGMHRREIVRKFDEIVAFAEVEQFLDTPVKRYSSGMYVRLAFAIAAHLEPEILIIDEVLAVGDVQFQKKCLGKMGEVSRKGRTVLFVSHNMGAIKQLCENCLWLEKGEILQQGPSRQIIQSYLSLGEAKQTGMAIPADKHMHQPTGLEFKKIKIVKMGGLETNRLSPGETFEIQCEFDAKQILKEIRLGMTVHTLEGTLACVIHQTDDKNNVASDFDIGSYAWMVRLNLPLMPGKYTIDLFAKRFPGYWGSGHASLDWVQQAMILHISEESLSDSLFFPSGGVIAARHESIVKKIL